MSSFFPTTVLVGVDGAPASHAAVMAAAELCRATGSTLHLVHVKLRQPLLHGQPMSPVQRERSDEEAQELLAREQAAVERGGCPVDGTHLRYGARVDQAIVSVQQELDAGLLVIGESGAGTLSRLLHSGTPRHGHSPPLPRLRHGRAQRGRLAAYPPMRGTVRVRRARYGRGDRPACDGVDGGFGGRGLRRSRCCC